MKKKIEFRRNQKINGIEKKKGKKNQIQNGKKKEKKMQKSHQLQVADKSEKREKAPHLHCSSVSSLYVDFYLSKNIKSAFLLYII
jgi:hypothetical protein